MFAPEDVARLAGLDGYDRMLAMDEMARRLGRSLAEVEQAFLAQSSGSTQPAPEAADLPAPAPPPAPAAERLDMSGLQYAYDPSKEAKERRAQVAQAIRCPTCAAALGIPDVRPIRVTCPACGAVTTFSA